MADKDFDRQRDVIVEHVVVDSEVSWLQIHSGIRRWGDGKLARREPKKSEETGFLKKYVKYTYFHTSTKYFKKSQVTLQQQKTLTVSVVLYLYLHALATLAS